VNIQCHISALANQAQCMQRKMPVNIRAQCVQWKSTSKYTVLSLMYNEFMYTQDKASPTHLHVLFSICWRLAFNNCNSSNKSI